MISVPTINIPKPWLLSANHRVHWAVKAKRTLLLRATAKLIGHQASGSVDGRARCVATIAWPDKRRRDAHNLMPTLKACIDGLVDAGVLPDDSDKHMIGPDLRVADHLCRPQIACAVTFTFYSLTEAAA